MDPRQAWRERLARLRVYKRGKERAVHKPLLLLLLMGRAARRQANDLRFVDIDDALARLLRDFGPPRKTVHPEFPFWHLQSDAVWMVREASSFPLKKGGSSPTKRTLKERDASGTVPDELWAVLCEDAGLRAQLAQGLLDSFWPDSLHAELLRSVGLDLELEPADVVRAPRDPAFRQQLLMAYERRCAVCGYDGRLQGNEFALDAAHIRWHCYAGPDTVSNGLLLCSFHHVAFDRGAFGLSPNHQVVISKHLSGGDAVEDWVGRFHGRPILLPREAGDHPSGEFVDWHREEVFRKPARALGA